MPVGDTMIYNKMFLKTVFRNTMFCNTVLRNTSMTPKTWRVI